LDPHQDRVADFVRNHSRPGDRIYVANNDMQDLYVNDVAFYFLAERACLSPYFMFDKYLQGPAAEQRRIMRGLDSPSCAAVILYSGGGAASRPDGQAPLDQALRDFGAEAFSQGPYRVRLRRP
jgi:hypothetical protein